MDTAETRRPQRVRLHAFSALFVSLRCSFRWQKSFSGRNVQRLFAVVTMWAVIGSTVYGQSRRADIELIDASESSKLDFVYEDGSSGKEYLVEMMGTGLALFDYDNDGWIDIYFLNGAALPGAVLKKTPLNALYRNNRDGTFADVTPMSGAGDPSYGLGVAIADYDNDGFEDCYVTNFGADTLLHNNGDGTFTDVTATAGVADGKKFGAGAAFLDIDGDGDVDLFSANYVDFTYQRHAELAPRAYPYPPVPADFPPVPDTLFRNNGDGTFTDISVASGIASVAGPSMGVVCGDFDRDGDTDIFVGCDGAPNHLYVNNGQGVFSEQALVAGLAFDGLGRANGSMGTEVGDIDNDGIEDIFITNYAGQLATLFRGLGSGMFDDISRKSGAGIPAIPHTKWGTGLVDFDNDGDRDIFISNGHMLKRIHKIEQTTDFKVANCLMANDGLGHFVNVTDRAGDGLKIVESSRGIGFDDLDNDGDVDCVVLNCGARANFLQNRSQNKNKNYWLELQLRGTNMNRSAVGARVKVVAGSLVQVAEVHSGRGYQSHYGSRLHFGLGSHDHIDRVEVQWLAGGSDVYQDISVDTIRTLIQR